MGAIGGAAGAFEVQQWAARITTTPARAALLEGSLSPVVRPARYRGTFTDTHMSQAVPLRIA
jgi:hypothetical protein